MFWTRKLMSLSIYITKYIIYYHTKYYHYKIYNIHIEIFTIAQGNYRNDRIRYI